MNQLLDAQKYRTADYPIEPLILKRWSPRAMSGQEVSEQELMTMFEAARWAPSSYNAQQWRALYGRRGTAHWNLFFELLGEGNKTWAKNAAVLVVFISRKISNTTTSHRLHIRTMQVRLGRISHCKAAS